MAYRTKVITEKSKSLIVTALICVVMAAPHAVSAQEFSTKGFSVEGHASVATAGAADIIADGQVFNPERENGVGGGLLIAYGATDWLTFFLNGDGQEGADDRHLTHVDIGAQAFLRSGRLRPHILAAFNGRRAEFDASPTALDTRGDGWSIGGGVLYFFSSPSFALSATLLQTGGALAQFKEGKHVHGADDVDVSSTRFTIGIRWYPGR